MKFLVFIMLLSFGCGSDTKDLQSDTGLSDTSGQSDAGQDLGDDGKMGLDIPDCVNNDTGTTIRHTFLEGTNSNADLSFTMALCQFENGIGESWIYRVDYFSLSWKGTTYDFDVDSLKYNNSHHNWFDSLEARSASANFDWSVKLENQSEVAYIHTLSGNVGDQILEDTEMDVTCENCEYFQFVIEE